ncbi:flagellar hook-length control protein FliK [Roseateles terrae]|uniref:Flagellar hook-length control protein FliK n=1 Tax=Roseateles terrae TaxID=431060 RepID=A0ABR6GQ10_9BURK|nr:flagellar hook-length control protein FliK [Roseateles terrae]MBB3194125.1 flagellar hook-length control protein FliK [Roseateles terrae]OWQ87986.1 hypothetical protein CDN98_07490 [Roseateles terrae]
MSTMTPFISADLARGTSARDGRVARAAQASDRDQASDATKPADRTADPRRGFSDAMAAQRRSSTNERDSQAVKSADHLRDSPASEHDADAGNTEQAASAGTGFARGQASKAAAVAAPRPSQGAMNSEMSAGVHAQMAALADLAELAAQAGLASQDPASAALMADSAPLTHADQQGDAADGASDGGLVAPWLLPTVLPTVMPPVPALMAATAQLPGGDVSAPGADANATPAAQASMAPALSGAVAADAAQLMSLKAQSAKDLSADAAPSASVTATADASAWAGLQRWTAALIDASGTALSPATARPVTDHLLAMPDQRQDWPNSLMQALGDRLQLQAVQRSEQARLHLMPPQLGRIEIDIRQQGGALQVQLSATHDEVRQQLRQMAEPLRHDLVQRHTGDVSVQVTSGAQASADGRGRDGAAGGQAQGQGGQAGQRDAQRQPGRALTEDALAPGGTFASLAGLGEAMGSTTE